MNSVERYKIYLQKIKFMYIDIRVLGKKMEDVKEY